MMAMTVEASLRLEVFSRVEYTIYAGQASLNTPIRWVHPSEVVDIARFLTGGEMLLTAGLGIGHSPEGQRRYLEEIADAGAAVLVIELSGRAFAEMPQALIDAARERDFPLVGLDGEVPFVEVSAQVHESLVDQRVLELTAYERLNAKFMQLLLGERDYVPFTDALADEVGHAVVLEDATRQVMAYSGANEVADSILSKWEHHSRIDHERTRQSGTDSERRDCTRRAVVLRGERWGWLHVLHGDRQITGTQLYALDRATDGIAIALLGARESGAKAAQRQNALVSRLLLGDISGETFVTRALRLGRDLRNRQLVVVYVYKESRPGAAGEEAIDELCRILHVPAVVSDLGDHTMAIIGLVDRKTETKLVDRLTTLGVSAGVSQLVEPAQLPRAVEQARSAVSVAAARPDKVVERFDDLGVLRLLASLAKGPELARYIEDELGPLLQHDAEATNPLLPTLRAYLSCDGNKTQAAQTLFVQRRTLYYRLERITAILGRSLDDPDARQALVFAVRGHDLLQRQGRPVRD
ncbi:PucR family transcriptional regulator [Rhodococcus sp. MSC1_016]|jgi:purine catabolism regulator|uniref:PucR family transcriptional regulator n=1 Tax=Rhodococcus sp. MSC1_016 TaxID=2909266 RepID=UPI00202EB275|nr:PucR family transcriptional regulator [Rhodococcus sp. MSC1_016]